MASYTGRMLLVDSSSQSVWDCGAQLFAFLPAKAVPIARPEQRTTFSRTLVPLRNQGFLPAPVHMPANEQS